MSTFPNIPSSVILGAASAVRSEAAGIIAGDGSFVLINLCGGGTFRFEWFPTAPISHSRRANWTEQDTTIGTKPLMYANRDPRKLDVGEVWLDKSDTGESIKPQMDALEALQDETCEGTPPPLLAVWGDQQKRVVLEEVRFEEMFHAPAGHPIRARCSLSLKEVQEGDR
jgi:contractile injection system tube protein